MTILVPGMIRIVGSTKLALTRLVCELLSYTGARYSATRYNQSERYRSDSGCREAPCSTDSFALFFIRGPLKHNVLSNVTFTYFGNLL